MRPILFPFLLACSDYNFHSKAGTAPGETAEDSPSDTVPIEEDEPCDLSAEDYEVGQDESCRVEVEPGSFEPVVEWQWTSNDSYPGYHQIMASPSVGELNDDNGDGVIDGEDVPDIVFTSFTGSAYSSTGTLTALSGDGSGMLWSIFDPGGVSIAASGGVAIGDLDGDGSPEICVAGYAVAVVCVGPDGSYRWAAGTETYFYGAPAMGDVDGDGSAEVVFGRQVFDAAGGVVGLGSGGIGRSLSFPLDVDGDGLAEIVAGSSLYRANGTLVWDDGTADGAPAAGDFDADGLPELVHVGGGVVYLVGADGVVRWSAAVPGGGSGGAPTVADFDGDGSPEVGVAGASEYTVLDGDGSVLWSQPVSDYSSNVTGSSVFDFEGDGAADVVYADEQTLWVYDGATGTVKLAADGHASGTLYEYPLIVDVDGDGATEIVLASNNYTYAGWNGITVIGDASGTWRPSRPVWNEYAYHITNIEDDGSIPTSEPSNWVLWNSFRAAAPPDGRSSDLADLRPGEPQLCTLQCAEETVDVMVPIENTGLYPVSGATVTLVNADGVELLRESLDVPSGAASWVGPVTISEADWGSGVDVTADPDGELEECDEGDNVVAVGDWPCP